MTMLNKDMRPREIIIGPKKPMTSVQKILYMNDEYKGWNDLHRMILPREAMTPNDESSLTESR